MEELLKEREGETIMEGCRPPVKGALWGQSQLMKHTVLLSWMMVVAGVSSPQSEDAGLTKQMSI